MRWFIEAAIEAWRGGLRALAAMPLVAALTFVFVLLANAGGVLITWPAGEQPATGAQILGWTFDLLSSIALVPFEIAVYRFVLLGEITPRYRVNVFEARFVRFTFYTIALNLLLTGALFVTSKVDSLSEETESGAIALVVVAATMMLLAVVLLWLLSLILFPAIAVDAPHPSWRDAVRDSAKHFLSVLLAVLVTGVPFIAVYFVLYWPLPPPEEADLGGALIRSVVEVALSVVATAVYAALVSRLYLAFADRLARPPALSGVIPTR